jgi:two-component system response regulator YesN
MAKKSLLEMASDEAVHYQRATSMACFVIDSQGRQQNGGLPCAFCRLKTSEGGQKIDCANVHLYGAFQAERFGGRYFYFCPASFLHWASPLLEEGRMIGAMVGGPALMVEPDTLFYDNLTRFTSADLKDIQNAVNSMPRISPEEAEAQSRALFAFAYHLCSLDSGFMHDNREQETQQRAIGEYEFRP